MRFPHHALVGLIAVVTLPIGILSAMFASIEVAAVVFVVGWFLLVPVLAILGEEMAFDAEEEDAGSDPVEALRERYARGEIDEVEFERRLEGLLATEDADATDESSIERALAEMGSGSRRNSAETGVDVERGTELE
jgi:uncharacterized membrane protein